MRYLVLACDFDGTIASDGRVRDETLAALHRLRDSGRKLVLVTGREIEDLLSIFPEIDTFDRVVVPAHFTRNDLGVLAHPHIGLA